MWCPYSYYKDEEEFFPRLYCKAGDREDKYCIYTKKCEIEQKFIPIDDKLWEKCYDYNIEKTKDIPEGSYYIQTSKMSKNGKLYIYVFINDKVERILTDYTNLNQSYIYLRETKEGFEVSLTPFPVVKKTTKRAKSEK